ncbi:MAG: helix-turn-helix domain-containing protein [Candidatus Hodarchaeales archaeon]
MYWQDFIIAFVMYPERRNQLIKEALDNYNLSIKKFAQLSGIPESTIYKISSSITNVRISTLTQIVKCFKSLESKKLDELTIGVITARYALQELKRITEIDGKNYQIAEYPASTIEDEIIQGINAQKEGCIAIICGPIAANTLNKVVSIPVIGLTFDRKQIEEAIEKAVIKMLS